MTELISYFLFGSVFFFFSTYCLCRLFSMDQSLVSYISLCEWLYVCRAISSHCSLVLSSYWGR